MNISSILLQQFRQKSLYAILLLIKVQSSAIPSCIVYSPLVQFPLSASESVRYHYRRGNREPPFSAEETHWA